MLGAVRSRDFHIISVNETKEVVIARVDDVDEWISGLWCGRSWGRCSATTAVRLTVMVSVVVSVVVSVMACACRLLDWLTE